MIHEQVIEDKSASQIELKPSWKIIGKTRARTSSGLAQPKDSNQADKVNFDQHALGKGQVYIVKLHDQNVNG